MVSGAVTVALRPTSGAHANRGGGVLRKHDGQPERGPVPAACAGLAGAGGAPAPVALAELPCRARRLTVKQSRKVKKII